MANKYLFIGAILSASLSMLPSCGTEKTAIAEKATAKVGQTAASTTVMLDTVALAPFYFFLNTSGKIEANASTQLKAMQAGTIQEVHVQAGEFVKKGQKLISLDQQSLSLAKKRAELALTKAELEFDNTLLGFPSIMQKDGYQKDSLLLRLRVASGLQEAEIGLKEAQLALKESTITAPFSGVLYNQEANRGAYVNAGEALISLYSIDPLLLKIELLETEAVLLKKGMPVEVTPSNLIGKKALSAQIAYINPMVDENGLVAVGIALKNPQKNTWLGMNAQASVKVPQGEKLIVPKQAVVLRSGKAVVFTYEKGLAKWNYVKTGLDNGQSVEILEGLEAGQLVITNNNLQLAHDAPVALASND